VVQFSPIRRNGSCHFFASERCKLLQGAVAAFWWLQSGFSAGQDTTRAGQHSAPGWAASCFAEGGDWIMAARPPPVPAPGSVGRFQRAARFGGHGFLLVLNAGDASRRMKLPSSLDPEAIRHRKLLAWSCAPRCRFCDGLLQEGWAQDWHPRPQLGRCEADGFQLGLGWTSAGWR